MRDYGRLRLTRTCIAPGLIQRIDVGRLERGPGLGRSDGQSRQRIGTVQSGVIADDRARGDAGQIGGHAALDEIEDFKLLRIDLRTDLDGIASVGEHRSAVAQHHGGAR